MTDNFWGGYDFPTFDQSGMLQDSLQTPTDSTPDLSAIQTTLVKRAMIVFFIIDTSGSMKGARIGAVNDAIRNLIPELKKREASNTNAEIKVAVMRFNSQATWETETPQPVSQYHYTDIMDVKGGTYFSAAFEALNEKLTRSAFLKSSAGAYTPLIILLTDGRPSDVGLYSRALNKLKQNAWFNYATKAGIALGEATEYPEAMKLLNEFTSNKENVLSATNLNVLMKQIQLVTMTGVNFVTKQGSLQNAAANITPSSGSHFGSIVDNVNNAISNSSANYHEAESNQMTGENPSIPGISEIDWDNDFPTFG